MSAHRTVRTLARRPHSGRWLFNPTTILPQPSTTFVVAALSPSWTAGLYMMPHSQAISLSEGENRNCDINTARRISAQIVDLVGNLTGICLLISTLANLKPLLVERLRQSGCSQQPFLASFLDHFQVFGRRIGLFTVRIFRPFQAHFQLHFQIIFLDLT